MSDHIEVEAKLKEAFEMLWGAYPHPASLVHKSRRIVAVNLPCRLGGRVPGMICSNWGSPERHQGCLANRALSEQEPFYKEVRNAKGVSLVYWLPIHGYPDYYVHFTTKEMSGGQVASGPGDQTGASSA